MKILIIEDEPDLRETIQKFLLGERYIVETAATMNEGLDKALVYDYDCILLDCSGYVSYLYSKFDIKLPRGAAAQSQYTNPIEREDVRPGDLLFFKGRNARSNRIGHVALVVSVDEDDITMMHSRNSRGIVIEKLNRSAYFSRRLVSYGRLRHCIQW